MFEHKFYKCIFSESVGLGAIDRGSFKKNSKLRSALQITIVTSRTDNEGNKFKTNELFLKLVYKTPTTKNQEKSLQRYLNMLYSLCTFELIKEFNSETIELF